MLRYMLFAAAIAGAVATAGAEEIVQGGYVVDGKAYLDESLVGGVGCGGSSCDSCASAGCHGGAGCCSLGCKLFGYGCDGCGHGGRRALSNLWENCDCNGSYKYPVPPLYTYFWPGLYSQQRMTDYSSPWRFPPLKPYTEENLPADLRPVSYASFSAPAAEPTTRHGVETTSSKMRRIYGE